jgi:transcriptional regulator of arginine metabolism
VREKEHRHRYLRDLAERVPLETQDQIRRAMEDAGFAVTQATVSRDIRELKLIKVASGPGRQRYLPAAAANNVQAGDRLEHLLADVYRSVTRAQNLVVLRVLPGNAHAVGAVLDDMNVPGLLGTIAGDDTLLLVAKDEDSARAVEGILRPPPGHP